jgi:DNA polymerase III gamma/tau subunit
MSTSNDSDALHLKYRPQNLSEVFGQEAVVTRLRGILNSGKLPNALAFFGPPSAGKTTLARCIAAEFNEKPVAQQQDFKEINAGSQRGIEDVRDLEKISKFRAFSKKRFIVIDEAHQLLSNNAAANALLKPLEEPAKDTCWIICSMEPTKFSTTTGKAILKRCTQFLLTPPTNADLLKQAMRIAKGENMRYLADPDKALLKAIVREADQDLRVLANLLQGVQQFYDGLEDKPKLLTAEDIGTVVSTIESSDDDLAQQFLTGLYTKDFASCQLALLDVGDPFQFMRKVVWMSQFLVNVTVLNGEKHSKVWFSTANKAMLAQVKKLGLKLADLGEINARLIRIHGQAMTFALPATDLLAAEAWFITKGEK